MKNLQGIGRLLLAVTWCGAVAALDAAALNAEAQEAGPLQLQGNFATSGIRRYTPGKWGTVDLALHNPTDAPISGTADIAAATDLQLQFARRFTVPPHSQRHFWIPVKIPADVPRSTQHVDLRGRLMVDTPSGSQLVRGAGEQMHHSPIAIIDHEPMKTALLLPKSRLGETEQAYFRIDKAHEVVIKARQAYGLSQTTIALRDDFLPPEAFLLEGADHFVLASDAIVEDSVGLHTLRQWLIGGGRLWVMLDMVSRSTVKELLGTGFDLEYVDRIPLNRVEWEAVGVPAGNAQSSAREFEYAVEMVRVLTDVPQVVHAVDGWPASMLMPYGDGVVLFTTLEGRAWLDLTNGSVVPEMNYLAGTFLGHRVPPRVDSGDLQPALQELIGYQIPRRRTVLLLLGTTCLVLFGAAGWVWSRERREWFAVAGPVVAVLTAGVFFGMGAAYKHQVNSSVVTTQVGTYVSHSGETGIHAGSAIYLPDTQPVRLSGDGGGLIWPEMAGLEGINKRIVWGDLGHWEWEELQLPAGIRPALVESSVVMPSPVSVSGRFGTDGFEGQFETGDFKNAADAIIATPGGRRLGVNLQPDGRFTVNSSQSLGSNQFTLESLLSDEQRRRRDIYSMYVAPKTDSPFPLRPVFLCWAERLDWGLNIPESFEQRGSALVAMPLKIDRTLPGQPFQVPSAFSTISLLSEAEGRSAAFNPRTGEWTTDLATETKSRLHFALPQQVLPADLDRAQLTIKINAPSRDVRLAIRQGNQDLELRTLRDANGVFTIPIDRADMLQVDKLGGVAVGVFVERQRDAEAKNQQGHPAETRLTSWTIDYVRLDVWGRTKEPSTLEESQVGNP